jgi:hypothetical protein
MLIIAIFKMLVTEGRGISVWWLQMGMRAGPFSSLYFRFSFFLFFFAFVRLSVLG